ncbi:hypothetical protein VB285_004456 [Salmonella enterica]|nr:hypothetical protein [Salmonella enterica]ELU3766307.1 hypothetical protein [Salmonella enterica]EMC1963998.1 hypothetical protein [Salmonella enterica]
MKKLSVALISLFMLSGCALQEDWNQCRAGDTAACQRYQMWQQGMQQAADNINQQNAIAAQQAAANRPVMTNCSPTINGGMSCTTF